MSDPALYQTPERLRCGLSVGVHFDMCGAGQYGQYNSPVNNIIAHLIPRFFFFLPHVIFPICSYARGAAAPDPTYAIFLLIKSGIK